MDTNHTDVIHHFTREAVGLLDHVNEVDDQLDALTSGAERSRNAEIGDLHREIGTSLKLAHIYATLAVAEALGRLRRPDTETVVHLMDGSAL